MKRGYGSALAGLLKQLSSMLHNPGYQSLFKPDVTANFGTFTLIKFIYPLPFLEKKFIETFGVI